MSAIAVLAEDRSQSRWSSVADALLPPPMQHSPLEIKEKLVKALDKDNNVVDFAGVMEVITLLEKTQITKEALEKTRLGKYINELRKKTTSDLLAKRAKELVRSWRKLILPQDFIVNGERSAQVNCGVYPVVSGPSWNSFHPLGKPVSPATSNHKNPRAASPVAVGSPVSWQCSSTSTSPALGPLHSGSRPSTPSLVVNQRTSPVPSDGGGGHHHHHHHLNSSGGRSCSPHDSAHARWSASPPKAKNEFHKVPPAAALNRGKSISPGLTADKAVKLSHSSSTELVDRTNAANKRLRKERGSDGDDHASTSRSKRPCADAAGEASGAAAELTNGLDSGESCLHSPHEQQCETQVPTGGDPYPLSKRQCDARNAKVRHEKSDSLKEKIASHARTPKVKTTAQLIEELKARNTVSVGFAASPSLPTTTALPPPHPSPYTRRPASSVLNNDHELSKTKTELLEKFLQATTSSYGEEPSSSSSSMATSVIAAADPVDEILARLPPIDADAINWDDGGGDDDNDEPTEPKKLPTDDEVDRLNTQPWEGMNGNYDREQNFIEWNEALTRISYDGDLLHILPYVNID